MRVDDSKILEIAKYYNSIHQYQVTESLIVKYSVENKTNIVDLSHDLILQYLKCLNEQS